ncbi:hypothetical protein BGZ75_005332 [Mortierella antarctica]|nr:hypothetical protein BGZ75_005332 [Mortierella antarctica]
MSSRYPPQSRMTTLVPQRTETLWYPRQMGVEQMHDELLLEEAAYENSLREVRVSSSHYIPIGLSKPFLNDDDEEDEDEDDDEDDDEALDRAHDLEAGLSQDGYDLADEAELDLDVDLDVGQEFDVNEHSHYYNDDNNGDASQDLTPLGSGTGIGQYPDASTFGTDMSHQFYSAPIEPDTELDLDRDLDLDLDGEVSEASSHGAELYSPQQHSPHFSP